MFRTAPGGGFRLRSWLFGGGGAERKKGKGKWKGGIHPQQGKRGAKCPHFTVSYILVKLIKFFVEKVKEERIIIIWGAEKNGDGENSEIRLFYERTTATI